MGHVVTSFYWKLIYTRQYGNYGGEAFYEQSCGMKLQNKRVDYNKLFWRFSVYHTLWTWWGNCGKGWWGNSFLMIFSTMTVRELWTSITYLVPYVLSCLKCIVPYMLSYLTCLVSYVLRASCLMCLTCSCTSHVLGLASSRAAPALNSTGSCSSCPSLASGVSSLTWSHASHVL